MNNEIINKYKNLGIHIEKTKSRQEIFTNVYEADSPLLAFYSTAVFTRNLEKQDVKDF